MKDICGKMADIKDYIEELMDLKKKVAIRFRSVEGAVSEIEARVVNVTTEGHRDILETDAGFSIGFDQLLSIDGRSTENYC